MAGRRSTLRSGLMRRAFDYFPELSRCVVVGKRTVRFRHSKKTAQRLPAFGDIEHEKPFRSNRGTYLFGASAVGGGRRVAVGKRAAEGLASDVSMAASHMARTFGGNGICE